jgi:hypothetical protein
MEGSNEQEGIWKEEKETKEQRKENKEKKRKALVHVSQFDFF